MGVFGFNPVDLTINPAVPTLVHIGFCKVNAICLYNHSTSGITLQLYDLGRVPILGVDVPTYQFGVGGGSGLNQGSPPLDATFVSGLKFVNGLAYILTQGLFGVTGGNTGATGGNLSGTVDWEIRP
jgi:hypothetical protein